MGLLYESWRGGQRFGDASQDLVALRCADCFVLGREVENAPLHVEDLDFAVREEPLLDGHLSGGLVRLVVYLERDLYLDFGPLAGALRGVGLADVGHILEAVSLVRSQDLGVEVDLGEAGDADRSASRRESHVAGSLELELDAAAVFLHLQE